MTVVWRAIRVRRAWPVVLGLTLVVALAHGGAVRNGFLYDDFHLVVENPAVSSHAWTTMWTSSEAASRDEKGHNVRPVTMTTYAVDHVMGGGSPFTYHLTQLVLHALVVCVVYLVGIALTAQAVPAIGAALLVGLHPVQTEAVQYLSARSSILSALGMLAALWTYLQARRAGPRTWILQASSLAAFAAAALSKETAVAGVAWFAAYELVVAKAPLTQAVFRIAPYATVAAAVWVWRSFIGGGGGHDADVSTATATATGLVVLGRHVTGWFVPIGIEPVSPQPWVGWTDPAAGGALLIVTLVLIAVGVTAKRLPLASFGLVCGLSALAPVLILPFLTNVALFQPHRGYAASAGFALATVETARALGAVGARWAIRLRPANRAVVGWVAALALLVGAVWTDARQGRAWRDEVRFWSEAVERYPREAGYRRSLGAASARAGDLPRALDAFTAAARLDPTLPRVHYNLGLVYTRMGRLDDALAAYERARERDPTDFKSLANLGLLYEKKGEKARALDAYRAALRAAPGLGPVREHVDRLERLGTISPWGATGFPAVAVPR